MGRIFWIALHTLKSHLLEPIVGLGVLVLVLGQEVGWRLGDLSIDSPQSVSLSVIYAVMHLTGGAVAISIGCRLWQRNRHDSSLELETIAPSGIAQCFIGRIIGLTLTIFVFVGLCTAAAWRPTLGPIAEMRPAFIALGLEQFILASAAACFSAAFGPLVGGFFAAVFWLCGLILPLVIGYLVDAYSPLREVMLRISELISLQRLQVVDPYALGDTNLASIDWPSLTCYTAAAAGFFLALGFFVLLSKRDTFR